MSNAFHYRDKSLTAEDVSLNDIAGQYGTPVYVYSRQAIETAWDDYNDALQGHGLVCYAVKANSNIGILSLLARKGSGFDIVSIGELERALRAGADPAKIVFSGVAKQHHEITRALEAGIHCFNVESVGELQRINEVAAEMGVQAPVSLRINPDVDAMTHPYISTGLKENKFGIDIGSAEQVYSLANSLSSLKIRGIDCHIGSQITEISPFLDALDRLLALVDRLKEKGIHIEHIDVGGGLGVRYQSSDQPPAMSHFVRQLLEKLSSRQLSLILEPGRSIVANAGVLLTRVEYLKQNDSHNFAIVDAGMNDLIRPSLYQAWMEVKTVTEKTASDDTPHWNIVGPICETGDFLAKDRPLPLQQGDLLAVMDAGAYGFTMASNYNTRPRVAELLVSRDRVDVIRKRETFEDLVAHEQIPDFSE